MPQWTVQAREDELRRSRYTPDEIKKMIDIGVEGLLERNRMRLRRRNLSKVTVVMFAKECHKGIKGSKHMTLRVFDRGVYFGGIHLHPNAPGSATFRQWSKDIGNACIRKPYLQHIKDANNCAELYYKHLTLPPIFTIHPYPTLPRYAVSCQNPIRDYGRLALFRFLPCYYLISLLISTSEYF